MTARVAHLWRHPIKSHGREALERATLTAGRTFPWDRVWAVAHEAAQTDGSDWAECANFSRGAKAPGLMGINATLDETSGLITLTHPDLPQVTLNPDTEADRLIQWAAPVMPQDRAKSARVVRVPDRGMTDTPYPSVSIGNLASHRAVEQKMGFPLAHERWRINIWLDGLAPWEEFDWIGRKVKIGDATLEVQERIVRCRATEANPKTGRRDAPTLQVLEEGWDHRDMGVYAVVTETGNLALGDEVEVI